MDFGKIICANFTHFIAEKQKKNSVLKTKKADVLSAFL